jgi:hypothetical protein
MLSVNLVPDDVFTEKETINLDRRDLKILFRGPRPLTMDKARAPLISNSGSRIADP